MVVKISGNSSPTAPSFAGDDGDSGLHASANEVQLVTNSTVAVTVDSSQNVGIGTTVPSSILDIQTGSGNLEVDALGGTSTKIRQTTTGGILALEGHSGIRFDKSSADEMARFDSSGNFGIGTATPATKLEVSDSGYVAVRFKSTDDTQYSLLRIQDNSIYVIGYGSSHSLHPNELAIKNNLGSGAITFHTGTSGTERLRIPSSGGLTFHGDTAAANALDDYEEGTWTPVSSTNMGTVTNANGSYVKIGNVVTVNYFFNTTSVSTSSTSQIDGLPFNVTDTILGSSVEATGVCFDDDLLYMHFAVGNTDNIAILSNKPIYGSATSGAVTLRGSVTYLTV